MIEDLSRHKGTKFTREERDVNEALRLPFFNNLEEIGGVYEMKKSKRTVTIQKGYQCGIAVYQLAKLRMLEFYHDFIDKYFSRQDSELCYMDKDSFYLAIRGDSLDDIVTPEIKKAYETHKEDCNRPIQQENTWFI